MQALIDATALGSGRGGDETMLRGLIQGLGRIGAREDCFRVLVDPRAETGSFLAAPLCFEAMTRRPGAMHFSAQLPWALARRRAELEVAFTVTHAPLYSPVPVALMVLDLSFLHLPDVYPRSTRARLTTLIGHQVHRVASVLTISEFCRQDLIDSYGLSPNAVHVVPLAIEPYEPLSADLAARAAAVLAEHRIERPFVLYLGNLHPRKNVARTIRAFLAARRIDPVLRDHQLVIAGGRWWGSGEEQAASVGPANSVIFLGRVDDATRRLLLERADALAYISRFEGFGLPPLEAMAASTPVLAGDAAAIPEVTGGAALLVDPDDDEAVTEGLRRILTEEALRTELIARGRVRAAHFDVASTGTAAKAALEAARNRGVMARPS